MDNIILTVTNRKNDINNIEYNIMTLKPDLMNSNLKYYIVTNFNIIPEITKKYNEKNIIFLKYDFEYFNNGFYKFINDYNNFNYINLLDSDDNYLSIKINKIKKYNNYDYLHNRAYYYFNNSFSSYDYNNDYNNNSCITINLQNFIKNNGLYIMKNTKSLSDFIFYLFTDKKQIINDYLTIINNNYPDFNTYKDKMIKRYELRLNDLRYLYNYNNLNKYINSELLKYTLINNEKLYYKIKEIIKNKKYINNNNLLNVFKFYKNKIYYIKRDYNLLKN